MVNFDAEKVTEVQELSRKAALRIYHIVTHMRLEPAPIDLNAVIIAASPVTTPVTPSEHVPYPEDNDWTSRSSTQCLLSLIQKLKQTTYQHRRSCASSNIGIHDTETFRPRHRRRRILG